MRSLSFVAVLCVAAACGDQIPNEAKAPVVTVVYDPAVSNLPTPNDLALDERGVVAIAPNPLLSDAENQLKASFNGRSGFSSASAARVQFSGAISVDSVTQGSVLAFDLGMAGKGPVTAAEVTRTWAECDRSLTLAAPGGYLPGHTYLFAVRGGQQGVVGARGEEVAPAPAFYFLRAGKDLTLHSGALPGDSRAERQATAEKLEAVRRKLEPLFAVLEAQGVPRAQVAGLWSFTVHTTGEALFDPTSKRIPFPNQLLVDGATGLVSLPVDPKDSPDQAALKRAFNQLDGFSTTAALSLATTTAIDRATVSASTVRLFAADGTTEVTQLERTVSADGLSLVLQPKAPLLPAMAYVVVVNGVRDVRGQALAPMPLASVLALPQSLLNADGHSALSSFCDDTAQRLEPLRAAIAPVLQANAIAPQNVSAVWLFKTQDILKRGRELWAAPYVKDLPLEVYDAKISTPPLTQPSVAKVITGQLMTFDRLDPTTRAFIEGGGGVPRKIHFLLTLPKGVSPGANAKVMVFGHGLYTDRTLMMLLAERLARAGFATMAIDFPYHGERTVCTADTYCSLGATCAADGSCLKGGQPADLARIPAIPGVPGDGSPTGTGQAFVDFANLAGTRDHFRQALIDLSAQVRLIRLFDWKSVTGGFGLDPQTITYAGISLGGIIGASESGLEPHFDSMLLNVAGAGLVDLMRESATFSTLLNSGLSSKGIDMGTPGYDQFLNAARWLLDEVDPLNLSPYAFKRPLNYVDPTTMSSLVAGPKRLRLQMAIGDTVVPNTSTRRLITASGVDEQTQFRQFIGTHGFLADPAEINCYVGQDDLVNFLQGN